MRMCNCMHKRMCRSVHRYRCAHFIYEAGLYAEILQSGGELGVFKRGAAASSVRESTGRQCLKISVVI